MNEITVFGVVALTFMMAMYALEGRHPGFTVALPSAVCCPAGMAFWLVPGPLGSWRSSGAGSPCGSFNCVALRQTLSEAS